MSDNINSFGRTSPTPSVMRPRPAAIFGLAFIVSALMIADTASAQGPLRRLGDRIRERAGGPTAPGIDSPATPASPLGRRPVRGRAQPNEPAAGNPAAVQPPAAARGGQAGARRSANYNRATATAPRMADPTASRVEQSSAWESRQDFRGSASRDAAEPIPRQSPIARSSADSISSQPPISTPNSRARLGIVVDTPDAITRPELPPRRPRGALVSEVQSNSAAEAAGITVGDLIVGVNGRAITSVRDLTNRISGYEPGDEVRFQLVRDDQLLTADVTLAGPDGIAASRAESSASKRPAAASSPSIMSGLGSAIGGLFGGPAGQAGEENAVRVPAGAAANNSPALSPESIRNSLPESLPPPVPERDPR